MQSAAPVRLARKRFLSLGELVDTFRWRIDIMLSVSRKEEKKLNLMNGRTLVDVDFKLECFRGYIQSPE